jgi:transcriptional regulator with XRE-family HTH domain
MKQSLKIRLLRHRAGLDQYQAAEKLKISVAAYSQIENGRVRAEDAVFESLVSIFGLRQAKFQTRSQKDWLALSEAVLAF